MLIEHIHQEDKSNENYYEMANCWEYQDYQFEIGKKKLWLGLKCKYIDLQCFDLCTTAFSVPLSLFLRYTVAAVLFRQISSICDVNNSWYSYSHYQPIWIQCRYFQNEPSRHTLKLTNPWAIANNMCFVNPLTPSYYSPRGILQSKSEVSKERISVAWQRNFSKGASVF